MKILALQVPALCEQINLVCPNELFAKSKILKRDQILGTEFMEHFSTLQSFLGAKDDVADIESWE